MPEERNQPLADCNYFLLFGILRIKAKAKQVLTHLKDLSFISAGPAHPGYNYFFPGGGQFKNDFEKGKRRTRISGSEHTSCSLLSSLFSFNRAQVPASRKNEIFRRALKELTKQEPILLTLGKKTADIE
jgi:hypothetical protein